VRKINRMKEIVKRLLNEILLVAIILALLWIIGKGVLAFLSLFNH